MGEGAQGQGGAKLGGGLWVGQAWGGTGRILSKAEPTWAWGRS